MKAIYSSNYFIKGFLLFCKAYINTLKEKKKPNSVEEWSVFSQHLLFAGNYSHQISAYIYLYIYTSHSFYILHTI